MTSIIKEALRIGEATHIDVARNLVQGQATERRQEKIARRIEKRHEPSVSLDLPPSVAEEARIAAIRRALMVSIEAGLEGQSTFTDRARVVSLLGQFETVTEMIHEGSTIGTVSFEE